MSVTKNIKEVFSNVRVKLYPNYLRNVEGAYIAKTSTTSTLTIEDVCAALKNRGGFEGNYSNLIENVKQYMDETAYQLCNGFSVSNGYFSIHPNIGGTFDSVKQAHDSKKNPITFRFRTMANLRNLVEQIKVEITGLADVNGYIDEFFDYDENSSNTLFSPGNQFRIEGYKIKIAGDDPSCGLYFISADDPAKSIKVDRIADNTASKITGIVPQTGFKFIKIMIKTQFSGTNNYMLKEPRVIINNFVLEAV